MSIQAYDVRCEYRRNPMGLDERKPRFGWKLRAGRRGVAQTAYRLQTAADETFAEPLWDTGRVESAQSAHVVYEGPPPASRTRYYVRVMVWDEAGACSDWSETAYWETAFLSASEWIASWIAAPLKPRGEADEPSPYVRKTFELSGGPIRSARVYATARGLYRLYVNGRAPDDTLFAPGWTSYGKRLQYQTYDVTGLLRSGVNVLGATLGDGWYKGSLAWKGGRARYGDERALLAQLHVVYADGAEETIVTDGTWTYADGPIRMSELYHGETYDARLEQTDWATPEGALAGERPVSVVPYPYDMLIAQENDPTRIVEELRPVALLRTPKGETVLDMGQNMVGWVRLSIEAEAGAVVTLQHAEVLDREGNFYTDNLRSARQTITYVCRGGGVETYEPTFSFQGFRYVKVEGLPEEGLLERFVGCVIHTDMAPTGTFACSDERINRLQQNIVWGQRGNFLDVPTDCPQRDERLGWTGDAQVFVRTAAFNYNVAPFFAKWLADLAAEQRPDGGVPHVVPNVAEGGWNSAAWGDAAVICPWTIYECYGDVRLLERQYPSMKAWVEYIRSQGEDEYLWNTGFHFGDWLGLDAKEGSYVGATPKDLIATAFYAHSASLVAKAAGVLGHAEEAAAYRALHERVVDAFRREFVTPNGRVASPTQTAYALALMFDLLEEEDRQRTAGMLARHIEENGTHLTTGFVGTPYLCHVLTRFGYNELAYRLVLQEEYPSWLYSVSKGATTIWEHWDGIKPDGSFWSKNMNSYNHYAYGAVGDWFYRVVAGIDSDPEAPGYRRIRIDPRIGEPFSWAEATFESMYGDIRSAWRKEADGGLVLQVTVPANATAEVTLRGASAERATEGGRPLAEAEGVQAVEATADGLRVVVGSGSYAFAYYG